MIQCSAKRWKFNIYLLEESLKGGLRNFLAIQSEENMNNIIGSNYIIYVFNLSPWLLEYFHNVMELENREGKSQSVSTSFR